MSPDEHSEVPLDRRLTDRVAAEQALERARALLTKLSVSGVPTDALHARLQKAEQSFGTRAFHDAEMTALETAILAQLFQRQTPEARMDTKPKRGRKADASAVEPSPVAMPLASSEDWARRAEEAAEKTVNRLIARREVQITESAAELMRDHRVHVLRQVLESQELKEVVWTAVAERLKNLPVQIAEQVAAAVSGLADAEFMQQAIDRRVAETLERTRPPVTREDILPLIDLAMEKWIAEDVSRMEDLFAYIQQIIKTRTTDVDRSQIERIVDERIARVMRPDQKRDQATP